MNLSFARQTLIALFGIAGVSASETPLLRGSRELQASNGADVICAYIIRPDGTRIPVISPCVDPPATAMSATVGTVDSDSDSED